MKNPKTPQREMRSPPTGPVEWIVRLRNQKPEVLDRVVSQSAFGAWRGSAFYRLGYAFSDVLCELEKQQ